MKFKTDELREQYWLLHPKLQLVLSDVNYILWKKFGKEAIITALIYEGGSGVHSAKCKRGGDVRTIDYLSAEEIAYTENYINDKYPYDPRRPRYKTCKWHKADIEIIEFGKKIKAKAYHLHMQVWIK